MTLEKRAVVVDDKEKTAHVEAVKKAKDVKKTEPKSPEPKKKEA